MPDNQLSLLAVALKMLIYSRRKFVGMIIGTTFAAFIIMQQPAIYQGVADQLTRHIVSVSEPDLWVMTNNAEDFTDPPQVSAVDDYRIKSIPGVLWVKKLYRGWYSLYHAPTNSYRDWQVIAVDPETLLGLPKQMWVGNRDRIRESGAMIVDGYALKQLETEYHKTISLGDSLIADRITWHVVGISQPLRTLSTPPKAYITSNHLPHHSSWGSFLLVKVDNKNKIPIVAEKIHNMTGYIALTQSEFIQRSMKFWRHKTPILPYFIFIAVLGFIIGLIAMWQIFNNFILTHLHQFGMLKMLGVVNNLIVNMVLFQTIIIGGIGYFLGLFLVEVFGYIVRNTVISFHLTWEIALFGAFGISLIIMTTSFFSVRKVLRFDSVELCRDKV